MSYIEFLLDAEWDAPFFKRLAHNDTGAAKGHQGGLAFPKNLREFLPTLDEGLTGETTPTVDRELDVELYLGTEWVTESSVRYQFQTCGGTRSPESRLTNGMLPLRSRSVENDVLVMQRQLDALEKYRFSLVKQGTPEYAELLPLIAERRWGLVWPDKAPIAQQQITEAKAQLIKLALKPFQAVTEEIKRVTGTQARIARSTAFRSGVRFEYDTTCAVSGIGVRTPTGLVEVEAAHVVPLKSGGSDDIRNGMALTSTLHWAFDHGLFGIKPGERRVFVPKQVLKIESCAFLHEFVGKPIRESRSTDYRVHDDALAWHMEHLTQKWEH